MRKPVEVADGGISILSELGLLNGREGFILGVATGCRLGNGSHPRLTHACCQFFSMSQFSQRYRVVTIILPLAPVGVSPLLPTPNPYCTQHRGPQRG
jgi:hypothetical protein